MLNKYEFVQTLLPKSRLRSFSTLEGNRLDQTYQEIYQKLRKRNQEPHELFYLLLAFQNGDLRQSKLDTLVIFNAMTTQESLINSENMM